MLTGTPIPDGAHDGYTPSDAFVVATARASGEPTYGTPTLLTADDLAARIDAARRRPAPTLGPAVRDDYDLGAYRLAAHVLDWLLAAPGRASTPGDWYRDVAAAVDDVGRVDVDAATAFTWGWAVNAARRLVELPPVPNAALLPDGGGGYAVLCVARSNLP